MISLGIRVKLVFFITLFLFSLSSIPILYANGAHQSQYTSKPPVIDGEAIFQEWSGSCEIWNDVGVVLVKNDGVNLYLLVDLHEDTTRDEVLPLGEDGDSVFIAFDVNLDSKITSTDIEFSYDTNEHTACYSNFLGPQKWTDQTISFRSHLAPGFGPTPLMVEPHRFWEASICLDEIHPTVGTSVRLGIEMNSATPELGYQTPENYVNDFSRLIEIKLQKPPQDINHLTSSPLNNHIDLDGRISYANEWLDTKPVYLTLTNSNGFTCSYDAAIWAKNNDKHLFFLIMVESNPPLYNDENGVGIIYQWRDGKTGNMLYDESSAFLDGTRTDWCALPSGIWDHDTHQDATGTNDVKAKGRYDGTAYWFELSKPLSSGDGCDWELFPGETIGGSNDLLYLVFWNFDANIIEFNAPLILSLNNDRLSTIKTVLDDSIEQPSVTKIRDGSDNVVKGKFTLLNRIVSHPLYSVSVFCIGIAIIWVSNKGSIITIPYTGEIDIQAFAIKTGKSVSKIETIIDLAVQNHKVAGFYTLDGKKFIPVDVLKSKIRERL